MATALLWDLIARDNVSGPTNRAATSMERLAVAAGKTTSVVAASGVKMAAAGAKMTKFFTLPVVAIGALSIKAATDFNSAMTKIQTQAGASAKDVATLNKQVLALAQYAQQGPTDLANALFHLKSVGMGNAQAMTALKQASDLAAVSGSNLEDTTNALAGAWKSGISGAQNFHHAVAELNAIVGSGNIHMQDMVAALGTGILPTAHVFGLTLKDVGAALALMTDEGVPASAAMTRLRMSFSLLGAPSATAEKQLNSIGLTGLKLATDMRQPNGLLVAVRDLKKHLDGANLSASQQAQLLSHAFGGGRSSSAILAMITGVGKLAGKYQQADANLKNWNADVVAQRKTPEAQFKLLESSLQRSAIILGNELLPHVVAAVKWVGKLVEKFNHLSPAMRTVITDSVLLLAALGPVVWTLGKLAKLWAWTSIAVIGMSRVLAGMAGMELGLEAMSTKSYAAGLKIRSAFIGLGTAIRNPGAAMSSLGTKLSGFMSTGAGFVTFLAAVGVAGYAAGRAISSWAESNNLTAHTIDNLSAIEQTFGQALDATNGKITDQIRKTVGVAIEQQGLADRFKGTGVTLRQLEDVVMGSTHTFAQFGIQQQKLGHLNADTATTLGLLHNKFGIQLVQTRAVAASLKQHTDATKTDSSAIHAATANTSGLTAAQRLQNLGTRTATQSIKDATAKLYALAQAQLTAMGDSDSFRLGLLQMAQAIKTNGTSLADNTQKGLANRQMIEGLASSLITWAHDTHMSTSAEIDHVKALQSQAGQLGLNTGALDKMLGKLGLLPKELRAASGKLNIDTSGAAANVRNILGLLSNLRGKEQQVGLNNVQHALRIPGSAAGNASVPDGVSAVGERGRELLVKRGSHLAVVPNGPTESFLRRTGASIRGFASGTSLRGLASRYRDWNPGIMAAIAMAESGGNPRALNNNPSTGDLSYGDWQINMIGSLGPARRREFGIRNNAALFNPSTNVKAAHMIWRDQGYGAWSTYNSGAYQQYLGDAGPNQGGGGGSGSGSGGGLTPAQKRARHMYYMRHGAGAQARRQAHQQNVNTLRSGLYSWIHAMGSPGSERKAFRSLLPTLRDLGASDKFITHLEAQNKRLDVVIGRRIKVAALLQSAQAKLKAALAARRQEASSVRSTARGLFDITTAGANANGVVTAGAMAAQQKQALITIRKWAHGIETLRKRGLSNEYLRQLAEGGPASWPQVHALLSSPGLFKEIQHEQRLIDRATRHFAGWESRQLYNGRIRRDRETVQDRKARLRQIDRHEGEIIRRMGEEMSKTIGGMKVEITIGPHGKELIAKWARDGEQSTKHKGRRVSGQGK